MVHQAQKEMGGLTTHTTILTVTGRKKYAVEAVVEGAQTAHKFAKKHDKSLKLEVQNED